MILTHKARFWLNAVIFAFFAVLVAMEVLDFFGYGYSGTMDDLVNQNGDSNKTDKFINIP